MEVTNRCSSLPRSEAVIMWWGGTSEEMWGTRFYRMLLGKTRGQVVGFQRRQHRSIVTIVSFPRVASLASSNFLLGLDSKDWVCYLFSQEMPLKLCTNFKFFCAFSAYLNCLEKGKRKCSNLVILEVYWKTVIWTVVIHPPCGPWQHAIELVHCMYPVHITNNEVSCWIHKQSQRSLQVVPSTGIHYAG